MTAYRCNICGGTLEVEQGAATAVCQHCGTKQLLSPVAENVVQDLKKVLQDLSAPEQTVTGIWYGEGIYRGDVVEGIPHGKGRIEYKNGVAYDGEWAFGAYCGQGKLFCADATYDGSWKDGKRSGSGTLTWREGGVFAAEWEEDRMCRGSGVWRYADGSWYEGDMYLGEKCGQGTYYYADGDVAEGRWVADELDGDAMILHPDGTRFVGVWKDGTCIEGEGVFYNPDHILIGTIKAGAIWGDYRIQWHAGGVFEGHQDEDRRAGKGIFRYADGRTYEGEIVDGSFEGEGTETSYPKEYGIEKVVCAGTWKKDRLWNGTRTSYFANGSVVRAKVLLGKIGKPKVVKN